MKYLLLILPTLALAFKCNINPNIRLDKEQLHNCYMLETLGNKFDLGKTLTVISYIESNLGKYNINLNDPSCGITHININTYLKRHNIRNTKFNANKACQDLLNDPKLAIANAIEELLYWKSYHCKDKPCTNENYKNIIKSYNTGYNYRSKKANEYLNKFIKAYKLLYK